MRILSSRNSPWRTARKLQPLHSPPPTPPPRPLRPLVQARGEGGLVGAPRLPTTVAASAAVATKATATAALQDRAPDPLVAQRSSSRLLDSSSRLPEGALGPASSPRPPLNLAPASKLSSATMGESLTTPAPDNSSSPRAFTFAYPALTPRLKMVKLNTLFALSIMLFAPYSFRHPCFPPTRWRPFPRRLFFSIYCPPRL